MDEQADFLTDDGYDPDREDEDDVCSCDESPHCHECNASIHVSNGDEWPDDKSIHLCWSCLVSRVRNLVMLVRRLSRQCKNEKIKHQALDYLKRKGFKSTPTR